MKTTGTPKCTVMRAISACDFAPDVQFITSKSMGRSALDVGLSNLPHIHSSDYFGATFSLCFSALICRLW